MELAECLVHCYSRPWRAKIDIELNIRRPRLRTRKPNWTGAMVLTLGVELGNLGLELAHSLLQRLSVVLLGPDTVDAKAPTRRTWSLTIAADLSPSTSLAGGRRRPPPARSRLTPHLRLRLPWLRRRPRHIHNRSCSDFPCMAEGTNASTPSPKLLTSGLTVATGGCGISEATNLTEAKGKGGKHPRTVEWRG